MEIFYSLNDQNKRNINAISARLSLRQPQRDSLTILAHVLEMCPPQKETYSPLTQQKSGINKEYF